MAVVTHRIGPLIFTLANLVNNSNDMSMSRRAILVSNGSTPVG